MFAESEPQHSLQHQLDEITANTRNLVPAERLAPLEEAISALTGAGVERQVLPSGSQAPSFQLRSATGKLVSSADLLALGPLVIKFFRGRWDPYDMTELETWQALQPMLREHRALVVGICPQLPRQNAFTAERHRLTLPLLSDPGCQVAAQFGLAYHVSEPMQRYYRSILVNIPLLNGDNSWQLPLPATYVLGEDASVLFAEGYADHRRRPEPAAVLMALRAKERSAANPLCSGHES